MSDTTREPGWRGFWNRGGWLKALLAVVGYLLLYRLAGFVALLAVLIAPDDPDKPTTPVGTPYHVFFTLTLPLILGAVVLTLFVASVRWFRPLFARQPIRGRWWMWIFAAVAVVPIVARLLGIDYARYGAGTVTMVLVSGLFVGFTEELLYRGIVVRLLRERGHREIGVAVISAALFALSHTVNLFSGQAIAAVGLTVVYTFGFGILMYLVMRVTGSLVWPMLIHAATDPTTILAVGGVDAGSTASANPFLGFAAPFNYVIIVAGILAIVFIRGRVRGRAAADDGSDEGTAPASQGR